MKNTNSIWITPLLLVGLILMFIPSCKNGTNTPTDLIPVLTTTTPTNITNNTATCGGTITSDGGSDITARGVCWSTSPNPTTADNKTTDAAGTGVFTSSIAGLTQATTYYVRAYATNKGGTAYGLQLSFTTQTVVTDIDGNIYHTVIIGTQTWMVENLKTTKYRNGVSIPKVINATTWNDLLTGAYCDYDNNPNNSITYGKLYNWNAVSDVRGIAPTGWHVPTSAEWNILIDYLGGDAGGKLKEVGTTHWSSPNTLATNAFGFTALPGGYCDRSGYFVNIVNNALFWTSTQDTNTQYEYNSYFILIYYSNGNAYNTSSFYSLGGEEYQVYGMSFGLSVRCVKD